MNIIFAESCFVKYFPTVWMHHSVTCHWSVDLSLLFCDTCPSACVCDLKTAFVTFFTFLVDLIAALNSSYLYIHRHFLYDDDGDVYIMKVQYTSLGGVSVVSNMVKRLMLFC